MSLLRIKELEAQLARRDARIAEMETLAAKLLDSLTYLRNCVEDGREPALSEVNAVIREAAK